MEPFVFLFLAFVSVFMKVGHAQVEPFLLDCGSNSVTKADGRKWVGDSISVNNYTLSSLGIAAATPSTNVDPIYRPLYQSARVFSTSAHYNFSVLPMNYCIRLHFFPFQFNNLNANDSIFDVTANNIKLVSKFNVSEEISWKNTLANLNTSYVLKEYFLNVTADELQIEFIPSPGSFAFVNAIEVIPVSNDLFVDSVNKVGTSGTKTPLGLGDRGIEMMYRLNVGGPEIKSTEDTGLWRRWESDERYMFSLNAATDIANTSDISYASANESFIAPLLIYETARIMTNNEVVERRFNLSWRFDVDPNFDYLVRLHFCELIYNKANQRDFKIYINNKTATEDYDVFIRAGGMNRAYHEDYFDAISQQTDTLWVQLGPDSLIGSSGSEALLNGLEIFKLDRNGNLAHALGRARAGGEGAKTKKPKRKTLLAAIGVGAVSLFSFSVASMFFVFVRIRKKKESLEKDQPPGWHPLFLHEALESTKNARFASRPVFTASNSMGSHRAGKMFTLAEIKVATRNFDESLVIGNGGFGKVYKGETEPGTPVAIKRANPMSQQGIAEFETEIEMLSKLRHRHLVSIIGYCEEKDEMILVYEYMANGTLRSHLYGSNLPGLSWKQRIEACIGAARGLHYLHTGADRGIIHRDVKTTNILLDENFVAKMADFGLSKAGPTLDHTHVSTAVKGSFGYLDPEYFRRQQLTQKSDVYSFGVVLFEVICARPVINPTLPKDQINLAEWAVRWQRQRSLDAIMDPRLEGECSIESLKKLGEIAEKCLADEGRNRPTMGEVLWHLEYALQLHDAYTKSGNGDSFTDLSFTLPFIKEGAGEDCSKNFEENAIQAEFSQLSRPQGR